MSIVKIVGIGHYYPENAVSNERLSTLVDTSHEWIVKRTGISERRISKGEGTVDLAIKAAINAMATAKCTPEDIDLILVARDLEKLNEVKSKLHTNVEVVSMDVSNAENCKELHRCVSDVDILINNAGFGDCGNFTKTDLNKELSMIKTNIVAYHILTKLYLVDMKAKNSGNILNVASIAGFMPGPLMTTYYSTKAYVVRLSESIREELKKEKSNVQISILCPGPVNTNFNNVANVKFHMREASSKNVADFAIRKLLKGKFYIIPGWDVKLAIFFSHFVPSSFISKITYMVQKRKLKK